MICSEETLNQVILLRRTYTSIGLYIQLSFFKLFNSSWQATERTWVNTLRSSTRPVVPAQGLCYPHLPFYFILLTVSLTRLYSYLRTILFCPCRHQSSMPSPCPCELSGCTASRTNSSDDLSRLTWISFPALD